MLHTHTHVCTHKVIHTAQTLCSLAQANVRRRMDRIKNLQKARILAPGWFQKQLEELTAIQTSARK